MLGAGVVAAVTIGCLPGTPPAAALPTWSPAGERIAFEKRTGAISVLGLGRFGGGIRELVHVETGTVTELGDWSPDGRQLVFARDGHIHVLDVESGEIR